MHNSEELKVIYESRYKNASDQKGKREIVLYQKYRKLLVSKKFQTNVHLLDLGCGIGYKTVGFSLPKENILAIDLSENAIDFCISQHKIDKVDFSNGSILVKKQKFNYDLIVLCTGINSDLYKKITINRNIEKNYKEVAITTTIKHRSDIKNARQYFLNEGPLAILPFSNNSFSVVWSIDATFFDKNYKIIRNVLKSKIQTILDKIKISSIDNIHSYPLYLNLKTNYFKKNVLILGDGLHTVHPMAGQGFNLVIRDVKKLSELISRTVKLGILISNSNILKDFFNSRKPENNILGLGVNLTNMFFKNNKYFSPLRNILLENVKNFDFVKKLSKQISNKGISI